MVVLEERDLKVGLDPLAATGFLLALALALLLRRAVEEEAEQGEADEDQARLGDQAGDPPVRY